MPTNSDIELELSQQLSKELPKLLRRLGILRPGYQYEVQLNRGNRKKRRDAEFEGNWDPDIDAIRISFAPVEKEEADDTLSEVAAPSQKSAPTTSDDRLSDLIRALDRAEARPGYEFVSLKWFRDTALTHDGLVWAADKSARHNVLREAIDKRWILTSKVPNPRPPHFPVTAIRVNRQMPEVAAVLGTSAGSVLTLRPVRIRGEFLSATVLHDRR